jgi:hypothetical protein
MFLLGYIFPIDILYMTIFLGSTIVGVFLNAFSVFIFYRPVFYSPTSPALYSYLRYESIIGIVGNIASGFYAIDTCADILALTNSYAFQRMQSYIVIAVYNLSYYAKFLIEVVIVADRIITLVPSLKSTHGIG